MRVPRITKPPAEVPRELHPVGRFDAKLISWHEIKMARSGRMWYIRGEFETEHGQVMTTLAGLPDALVLIKRAEEYYRTQLFKLEVKHREVYDGIVCYSADIVFERQEYGP